MPRPPQARERQIFRLPWPQQLWTTPGQSASELQRMTPGESRQATGCLQLVDRFCETQQTEPEPHSAVSEHENDASPWQLSVTAMHVAVGTPF